MRSHSPFTQERGHSVQYPLETEVELGIRILIVRRLEYTGRQDGGDGGEPWRVVPAGILGFTVGAMSPFGPVIRVSNVLLATLWLTFTITGLRMARQRRLVEHRRWMIRSFALTMSIITNRVWAVIATIVLMPQLGTTFGGNEAVMTQTIAGLAGWLGWVVTLLIAEWWLERDVVRRAPLPAAMSSPARGA